MDVSIGWWITSLYKKWLFHYFHPFINKSKKVTIHPRYRTPRYGNPRNRQLWSWNPLEQPKLVKVLGCPPKVCWNNLRYMVVWGSRVVNSSKAVEILTPQTDSWKSTMEVCFRLMFLSTWMIFRFHLSFHGEVCVYAYEPVCPLYPHQSTGKYVQIRALTYDLCKHRRFSDSTDAGFLSLTNQQ